MTIQITIIGLGQIGASIGLALKDHKDILRIGNDREMTVANQAEKLGAVDKVIYNLPNAVRAADLVLLALPVDQIRPTLESIAQELKDNAVVIDTAPVKETVLRWAAEILPSGRYYVGLTPALNPAYFSEATLGLAAAHADLFKGSVFMLVLPPGTPAGAVKLATDLTALLDAEHLFVDPVEVDSLMAMTHLLPQLVAAALLNLTVDQPGWQEMRKVAGRPFAALTGLVEYATTPEALIETALANPEVSARVLNSLVSELHTLARQVSAGDRQALLARAQKANHDRMHWLGQRQRGQWSALETAQQSASSSQSMPKMDWVSRLFGTGLAPRAAPDSKKREPKI